jgi:hypothetical protein
MLDLLGVAGLAFDTGEAYVGRAIEVVANARDWAVPGAQLRSVAPQLFDGAAVHAAFANLLQELEGEPG